MSVKVVHSECVAAMTDMAAKGILFDACVTDPPYHLTSIVERFGKPNSAPAKFGTDGAFARASKGFMSKVWDGGDVAFRVETWEAVFRVLKPGGHLLAFSGTRTYHRMVCAIEDAGFEIRDCIRSEQGRESWPGWAYASGFPKSLNVERGIAMHLCTLPGRHFASKLPPESERLLDDHICPSCPESLAREGFGTALKPAWEPIVVARKPLSERTVVANVLAHGTGALNIDACRVPGVKDVPASPSGSRPSGYGFKQLGGTSGFDPNTGRWPANLVWSVPEDEYQLMPNATTEQKRELFRWFHENA